MSTGKPAESEMQINRIS